MIRHNKETKRPDRTVEILHKLSLPITVIIASLILGSFFYVTQVSKQKSIEKQQQIEIEQKKQEELKEQEAKEEKERMLNSCIVQAEQRYSDNWYSECKSRGELTSRCISLHDMTVEEYTKQNPDKLFLDYYKERDVCSCRLPTSIADGIGDFRDRLKDECFKKYPQK